MEIENWLDYPEFIDHINELFEVGLYEEGIAKLDAFKELYDHDWELHFLYARAFIEQNKPQEALPYLRLAYTLDKKNPDCLLELFYTYSQLNRIQRGARYLLRALKFYPQNEFILTAVIWYYSEINFFDKAIESFEDNRTLLIHNAEALRNVGIAYERIGRYDDALQCFSRAMDLNPDLEGMRDILADHYILRGEAEKGVRLYKEYLKTSPNNIRAMSRLVYCLSQSENHEEAEKVAQQIITCYPNSPLGYVDRAYIYLNSNKINLALESAGKALDISPLDAEAYRVKGIAYSELKDFKQAESSFKRALALSPDNTEILRDYYQYLRNARRFKRMEQVVHKVIKLEKPFCIDDYWFLADFYRENNHNIQAFHYLAKAYKSMPSEKELIPSMAEILLDMGHTSFAIPILKKYIDAKGWDEIMAELARHKRLKNKWDQEGIRFLQFYGQKVTDFRRFIFAVYLRKSLSIVAVLMVIAILFTGAFYFNSKGFGIILGFIAFVTLSLRAIFSFIYRQKTLI
ncbi:MAG: tetratricopeptide repeat protein [Chitinivibrionales bacterium]|nr:tetratricopeptide repeat protein [Chitinivibrionales bacterium]